MTEEGWGFRAIGPGKGGEPNPNRGQGPGGWGRAEETPAKALLVDT